MVLAKVVNGVSYGFHKDDLSASDTVEVKFVGNAGQTLTDLAVVSSNATYTVTDGVDTFTVTADGADEEAIKNVVARTIEKFGKINTLVNNAQVSKSGLPLIEHTKEDLDLSIHSGLYAAFFYMRECHPYLKESKGSVINFASGAGLFGKLGQSSYAAAKEGIRGLSRVAAAEWGPDGIRVNVICPLAMTESLQQWREQFPDLFEKTIQGIPLGRFADPKEDIGRVAVFLASEDAHYVTGETITLQGGSGLRP